MSTKTEAFDPVSLFAPDLPTPAARWSGFPKFNFVGGHNDPDGVPGAELLQAAQTVLERDATLLATYNLESGAQGYLPLREFVAHKLGKDRGMKLKPDDVLITSGSLQGLDLVNNLFIRPGDTVLVEEHCYGGALSRLRSAGANIIGIAMDEQGLRIDSLADTLAELKNLGSRPKFLYTIPTIQNPTSAIMGEARRQQLLELAAQHKLLIFEDECYADLVWAAERPPALHALDASGRVIHIGSFSKSIAPALRVGYLTASWPVLSQLLACKTDAGSGALEQMILAEFCAKHFDSHVERLNARLKTKSDALCDALEHHFGAQAKFTRPAGGIFQWVQFPDAIDTLALVNAAKQAGIAYNPGPEWSTNSDLTRSSMRLCFANPSIAVLQAGVATLADVFAKETGIPARDSDVAGKTKN